MADLGLLAALAREHPQWRWYALADSAQNLALPAALGGTELRCLLGATQDSPLAQKSPHLVAMPSPVQGGAGWEWIARMAPRQPSVTLLASRLPFEALFGQLQQWTEIRLPDDTGMFFAFWDPAILGTLVGQADDATLHVPGPVLDEGQRAMLYSGLSGWWYWDRSGALHALDTGAETPPLRLSEPLQLTQPQVDQLVEASVPDHVLYFVDLNQPQLLTDIAPRERYGYVERALRGARAVGLETMSDMVNYVCAALIYGVRWQQDPQIAGLLARVRQGELRFSAALELMP